TRNAVMDIAREMGVEVLEIALTKYDAYVADECFLTGSAAEVIAVVKIDGRVIGEGKPGPITRELKDRFHKLTQS
ncbi:MAG: branched-chain amino acid aminotransferase, partial [Pirellulales bacterium]|nr:branched-chain amino acid aminotransferase [Pirellulales bacterium]